MPRTVMCLTLLVGLLLGSAVFAQKVTVRSPNPSDRLPPGPILNDVSPPGVSVGAETTWTINGQNLKDVKKWFISGSGVDVIDSQTTATTATIKVRASASAEPGYRDLRAIGPGGLGNLAIVRIDQLAQIAEVEPNDRPDKAQTIAFPSAVCGTLKPQDLDVYKFEGKAGTRIMIEVEARRLGTLLEPVVSLMNEQGASLAQGRETQGTDKDCRLAFTLPRDGIYLVQVRDHVYNGDARAHYRLRVDEEQFATSVYPLGGPSGETIEVTLGGGNLEEQIKKKVQLPDQAGRMLEIPQTETSRGRVIAPMRLIVGDGPETGETAGDPAIPQEIKSGSTINGRISQVDEIDRYVMTLKKGESVRLQTTAAPLGSWLDSVLTVRDAKGAVVVENDDAGLDNNNNRRVNALAGSQPTLTDSKLEFQAPADGVYTVEIADRYGDGGLEFAYRLERTQGGADFTVEFNLGPPGNLPQANQNPNNAGVIVQANAYSLKPGGKVEVRFAIRPDRFQGEVEVRAEGLPPGVSANPVIVQVKPGNQTQAAAQQRNRNMAVQPIQGAISLFADPYAEACIGELRLIATGKFVDPKATNSADAAKPAAGPAEARTITRLASTTVPLRPAQRGLAFVSPIRRRLDRVPVAIVGEPRKRDSVAPRPVSIGKVTLPAVLLQGGDAELVVALDPPSPEAGERFYVEVDSETKLGLLVEPYVSETSVTTADGKIGTHGVVKVRASVTTPPGVHPLTIRIVPERVGAPSEQTVSLIVHPPGKLRVLGVGQPIALKKGTTESIWVGVEREPGIATTVDLRVLDLPAGVRMVGRSIITANQSYGEIKIERLAAGAPLSSPVTLRIVGLARMARGAVELKTLNPPRIVEPTSDK